VVVFSFLGKKQKTYASKRIIVQHYSFVVKLFLVFNYFHRKSPPVRARDEEYPES